MISDPRKRPLFRPGAPSAPAATGPIAAAASSPAPIREAQPAATRPDTSFLQGPVQAAPPAPSRPAPAPTEPIRPAPSRPAPPADAPRPPETGRKGNPPVINSTLYWWLGLIAGLLIVAMLVHHFWPKHAASGDGTTTSASGAHGGRHGGHGGAGDTIRVVVATAAKGDIGVYLTGLGAVTPLNTDTIKSRVNGQLMKVLFTEGQTVKQGDLLVEIDSRPYEAQLAQYIAQKEHDEALLENATSISSATRPCGNRTPSPSRRWPRRNRW